ncbi:MAG: histidinol-phosphate transaminase [Candidatus Marinimicrobia bacterium]|nr:histidinol-phosphate transaminase [Candidatus Neomarinimicrobiota bacterium]
MIDIQNLLRPNIRKLKPYSSARDEYSGQKGIFLDANENSFGTLESGVLNRYPDPYHRHLKKGLEKIYNINSNKIFTGNGSDEAIDLLIRAFCIPGKDSLIVMPPTYGMYNVAANINDINIINVPLSPQFKIRTDAVLEQAKDAKLIFICSPNNPTGNIFNPNSIKRIAEKFDGIVVLDEAYIDFTDRQNGLVWLNNFNNLVVLRTFSKAWGMANIRLGMAFADPEIIAVLNKIKYPYNVNGLTCRKAMELIKKQEIKKQAVESILKERTKIIKKLNKISGVKEVFPTEANFVLARYEKAIELFNYLRNKKIIIRNRTTVMHCSDCLRITVGKPQENDKLLKEIENFYN